MSSELSFICPLFVPANRPDRFEKAAASGSDAIILDLEDAVAASDKEFARRSLRTDFTDLPIIVRINGSDTPWYDEDLAAVRSLPVSAVMFPKADADRCATLLESEDGGSFPPIIALVETAIGLVGARELAALPGLQRLAFGSIDFCADLGCSHSREALLAARSALILASRLSRLTPPLDGITMEIDSSTVVSDDAAYANMLGFGGKLCIHPKQVRPILNSFRPVPEDVEWAHRVLQSGDGATTVDGIMVDEPVRIKAKQILARSSNVKL